MTCVNLPAVVYPPNRPLERILAPSRDPVAYHYLCFIDINEKGEIIVGSSNLTGAFWEGTLYYYKNGAAAITEQYSSYFISPATIVDAKFINSSKQVVVAEDSGCLRLLSISDGDPVIICNDFLHTNARLQQLSVWDKEQKVLACAGTSLVIWDIHNMNNTNSLEEYKNYHTELVTSVDVRKTEINIFASTSMDRKACIWDDRMKIPATVLYQNEFSGLTSVAWNQVQAEYVVVGSQGGGLYNLDIRQPKEIVESHQCFDGPIYRTAFNQRGYLAVCGDKSNVIVLNSKDNFNNIYTNNDHSAFVRGVAWYAETMYSCGFDKKIIKHIV